MSFISQAVNKAFDCTRYITMYTSLLIYNVCLYIVIYKHMIKLNKAFDNIKLH